MTFDGTKPASWIRLWAALSAGNLIGASVVPVLTARFADHDSWSEALHHGQDTLWDIGIPTVAILTAITAAIVGVLLLRNRRSNNDNASS
ncbi:hypothetical protein KRX51_00365 [Corynebacterium sp. TAE3-ERU12]|uniref:hypothetical protein n=1 Tax=Corynebacterium sp. TAE3-ERU12 TaxID=2849491 RepID=UPI001C47CBFC|nr:hypothetical protein [Corynebacterium sp. TAE3-ERU12]MBV7294377.1 hypothetical protein [Corynebacterium sp. TAE3-ERU12]